MTSGTTIFDTTIQAYTGSTGAPSITFGGNTTGLYGNSNSIGFSISSADKMTIGTSSTMLNQDLVLNSNMTVGDTFIMDNNLGTIYTANKIINPFYISPLLLMTFKDTNNSFLQEFVYNYSINNTGVTDGTNVATFTSGDFLSYFASDFKTNNGTTTELTYGIRFSSTTTVDGDLFWIYDKTNNEYTNLRLKGGGINDGRIEFLVYNQTAGGIRLQAYSAAGTDYGDGSTYYVMATLGSGGYKLYINGVENTLTVSSGSVSNTDVPSNIDEFSIGGRTTNGVLQGASEPFVGDVSRVFMCSNEYTLTEISDLYGFTGDDAYNNMTFSSPIVFNNINNRVNIRYIKDTAVQSITSDTYNRLEVPDLIYAEGIGYTFDNVTNYRFTNTSGYTKYYFVNIRTATTSNSNGGVVTIYINEPGTTATTNFRTLERTKQMDWFMYGTGSIRAGLDTIIKLDNNEWFEPGVYMSITSGISSSASDRHDLYTTFDVTEIL